MNELYEMIEERIKASGYPGEIDGREFYNEVSAEADDQELGTYLFLIKKSDTISYKGCMTILEDQFDLHYVDILTEKGSWHVDFDA